MTGPAGPGGPGGPAVPGSSGGPAVPDSPGGPAVPGGPGSPGGPGGPAPAGPGRDGPEDLDPGLARERTSLAWTRTALSFAAVGAFVLKKDVAAGLVIMAAAPVIWRLGRLAHHRPGQLKLVAATIVAVALVALVVAATSG
jgi:hypothetical protein